MENVKPKSGVFDIDKQSAEQYTSPWSVLARWEYYKHAELSMDFLPLAYNICKFKGSETILDIGCGHPFELRRLRDEFNHRGKLIGVDIDEALFYASSSLDEQDEVSRPLDLRVGSAENLLALKDPIETESIDVTFANYSMYHMLDVDKVLQEIFRVLKPNGLFIAMTSGSTNKLKHRKFECDIAQYLGISPPSVFSEGFNSEKAEQIIPQYFTINHSSRTFSYVNIFSPDTTGDNSYSDYINSLLTMIPSFSPPPHYSDFKRALDAIVEPKILTAIEREGKFQDTAERHLFICQKINM